MRKILIAGAAVVAVVLAWVIVTFNRLVRGRNLMREAWSGMDVQLKRRYNLIPNLVRVVEGYAVHERNLLDNVTRARTQCMLAAGAAEKSEPETGLSQVLRNLIAVAEGYPDLKANRNFLDLQDGLSEIEDQIQLARRYYNGTVRNYNIRVESFPGMLVAGLFRFRRADFFEIEYTTERQVPEVDIRVAGTQEPEAEP